MQPFICSSFLNHHLIASRNSNSGVKITENQYKELFYLFEHDLQAPDWVKVILNKLGYLENKQSSVRNAILVRKMSAYSYVKASYEIAERCNYRCVHCFLGRNLKGELSISEKKIILKLLAEAGCLWLQITGGEPFLSDDFFEAYEYAYSLGFLVTISSNGYLLGERKILKTLLSMPPYRLTVSLYGATKKSYESLTQKTGSFYPFLEGLKLAKEAGINLRINIIVTKHNESEHNEMIALAKDFTPNFFVYPRLSPTLNGDSSPLDVMIQNCNENHGEVKKNKSECMAGKTFLHVDSLGNASVCKVARHPNINLLDSGISSLSQLSNIADQLLKPDSICSSCDLKNVCSTCAPRVQSYRESSNVPSFICAKQLKGDDIYDR